MPMYPRDRLLAFLAKIANEPGPDLEPRNWLEYYLDKIAENGGSSGGGGGMTLLDYADINSYSATIDGVPFNSYTDSLRIDDGLYEPFTYGFVDSLDAPFAVISSFTTPGETQSETITELPTYFETIENYSNNVPSGDFRLAMADKVIKIRKLQTDTELFLILIVGNFRIEYGGES